MIESIVLYQSKDMHGFEIGYEVPNHEFECGYEIRYPCRSQETTRMHWTQNLSTLKIKLSQSREFYYLENSLKIEPFVPFKYLFEILLSFVCMPFTLLIRKLKLGWPLLTFVNIKQCGRYLQFISNALQRCFQIVLEHYPIKVIINILF